MRLSSRRQIRQSQSLPAIMTMLRRPFRYRSGLVPNPRTWFGQARRRVPAVSGPSVLDRRVRTLGTRGRKRGARAGRHAATPSMVAANFWRVGRRCSQHEKRAPAGAALAMESIPAKSRGVFSGIFQEGYALDNLLAAIAFWVVFPRWAWRTMFFIGVIPALLTLFILSRVKESDAWKSTAAKRKDGRSYFRELLVNWKRFAYMVILMAMMNFLSHGTQDLYPTYLQQQRHYRPHITAILSIISMLGAIAGAALFGLYSDHAGRRRAMLSAVVGGLVVIPLWVFSPGLSLLALGAFLMQFMVHGAWGVIPAHINELSPDRVRGFLPGFSYQLGVVFAASAPFIEASLSRRFSYGQVMGTFVGLAMVVTTMVIAAGPEAHRVAFGHDSQSSVSVVD
ncbi:MAG: MFS transporter [Candidatus Acidiferrales bacterium]